MIELYDAEIKPGKNPKAGWALDSRTTDVDGSVCGDQHTQAHSRSGHACFSWCRLPAERGRPRPGLRLPDGPGGDTEPDVQPLLRGGSSVWCPHDIEGLVVSPCEKYPHDGCGCPLDDGTPLEGRETTRCSYGVLTCNEADRLCDGHRAGRQTKVFPCENCGTTWDDCGPRCCTYCDHPESCACGGFDCEACIENGEVKPASALVAAMTAGRRATAREDAAMTDKTCAALDCDRPADYRVYPYEDPDLMHEGWYVCEQHVEQERQRGHGVERDIPVGADVTEGRTASTSTSEESVMEYEWATRCVDCGDGPRLHGSEQTARTSFDLDAQSEARARDKHTVQLIRRPVAWEVVDQVPDA